MEARLSRSWVSEKLFKLRLEEFYFVLAQPNKNQNYNFSIYYYFKII